MNREPILPAIASMSRTEIAMAISKMPAYAAAGRRTNCGPIITSRCDAADRRQLGLLLLGNEAGRLDILARSLGVSHGDARRIVDLAGEVRLQGLTPSVSPGSILSPISGRAAPATVVGSKPRGFLEGWQFAILRHNQLNAGRLAGSDMSLDEELVWTVDPTSADPGISQSRLSDWMRGFTK